MPQMSPLLWVPILMFNLFMILIIIMYIHFSFCSTKIKPKSTSPISNYMKNKKWIFLF
nr:TPA_asm: ATP synthase F0 subunit 8 [Pseudomyrmex dendroicus]